MSPSAWQRGIGHGIFYTLNYLAHLEEKGVRVVNGLARFHARNFQGTAVHGAGSARFALSQSRGDQSSVAGVERRRRHWLSADHQAEYRRQRRGHKKVQFAGRIARPRSKRTACRLASTTLRWCRKFFTARDGVITRVEVLGGEYLYAIQIHITGDTFDLCPADICKNTKGEELTRLACPVDAPKSGLTVEAL